MRRQQRSSDATATRTAAASAVTTTCTYAWVHARGRSSVRACMSTTRQVATTTPSTTTMSAPRRHGFTLTMATARKQLDTGTTPRSKLSTVTARRRRRLRRLPGRPQRPRRRRGAGVLTVFSTTTTSTAAVAVNTTTLATTMDVRARAYVHGCSDHRTSTARHATVRPRRRRR